MTTEIFWYCVSVFVTQLIFIGSRTLNVKAISSNNVTAALLSGTVIHVSWLVSIAIGVQSMTEIISNFRTEYIPVVICSLAGGLLGTYVTMKRK